MKMFVKIYEGPGAHVFHNWERTADIEEQQTNIEHHCLYNF